MKTPDKIYVPADTDPIGYEAYQKKYPGDTEYIRKDTLLEWAKEKVTSHESDTFVRIAYESVVNKIESL